MKFLLKVWNKIKTSSTQQVMSITSVGMVLMLLQDILIAAWFGTSELADALIIALTFPFFLDTVARESTKYSLVPIFIKYQDEQEQAKLDLQEETPVLSVLQPVSVPLEDNTSGFLILIVSGMLGGIISLGWMLVSNWWKHEQVRFESKVLSRKF